jgi:hypothetical protein
LVQERPERPADLLASRISKLEDEIRALTAQLADRDRALAELAATLERRSAETAEATLEPQADGDASLDRRSMLEEPPGQPPAEELPVDNAPAPPEVAAQRGPDAGASEPRAGEASGGGDEGVPTPQPQRIADDLLLWPGVPSKPKRSEDVARSEERLGEVDAQREELSLPRPPGPANDEIAPRPDVRPEPPRGAVQTRDTADGRRLGLVRLEVGLAALGVTGAIAGTAAARGRRRRT